MALGIPTPEELNSTPDPNAAPAIQPAPQPSSVPAPVASGQSALASPNDIADAAMKLRVSQPAPGSFGAKLAQALDNNPIPLKPNGKPEPGGWSRSILGATQNVLANLGDISTEKAPAGAGIFSGFAKAQANNQQRLAQQKAAQAKQAQQDFENQQAQAKLDLATQKNQLDTTEANMRMQHQQAAAHLAGMDDQIAQGNKTVKMLEDPGSGHPTPIAARDITYGDIQKGVIDGKWNLHDFTAFPTGRKVTGEDADGEPQYTTTYTLLNAQGKVTPSEDEIKYLNDNKVTSQPIVPGQEFNFAQWNSLHQNADDISTATKLRNKALMDYNVASEDDVRKLEPSILGKNPLWMNAIANAKGDPVVAYNTISKNPAFLKQFPNLAQDMKTDYPEFDKLVEIHATEQAKLNEDAAKKAADDQAHAIATLRPEVIEKVNTLPAATQKQLQQYTPEQLNSVYDVAYGEDDASKKFTIRKYKGSDQLDMETGQTLAHIMNPAYDPTRAPTYAATRKGYSVGGQEAKGINSSNTAIKHIGHLYDLNEEAGTMGHIGLQGASKYLSGVSPEARASVQFQTTLDNAAPEITAAYSGGAKGTKDEVESKKEMLNAPTYQARKAQIQDMAKDLATKLNEYQKRWNEGAVPGTKPPMNIVDDDTKEALNKILGDQSPFAPKPAQAAPKPAQAPRPAVPPGIPPNATHIYRDAKGNIQGYALNGQYVPLEAK